MTEWTRRLVLRSTVAGVAGAALLLGSRGAPAADCNAPKVVLTSAVGIKYCMDPAFDAVIQAQVQKIREDIRAQRQTGKMVVYGSTPISPRGGGHVATNLEIAASVKTKLETEYGAGIWVLDPGKYQMADVDGRSPGGGEYMVMWTAVIAGEDGTGKDFDVAHFTGPHDMQAFFGCGPADLTGCVDRWVTTRAASDAKFKQDVADQAAKRWAFVRYYALRASSAYSSGAHDEWNIFVRINRKRPIGEQVAVVFDGRPVSPAEMETEISPGYEFR